MVLLLSGMAVNAPVRGGLIALLGYLILGGIRFYYLKKITGQPMMIFAVSVGLLLSLAWHFPPHDRLYFVIYIVAGLNCYSVVANAVYFSPALLRWLTWALEAAALVIAADILLDDTLIEANPNILGGYLAPAFVLLPLAFKKGWPYLIFLLIGGGIIFFALYKTSSQASLLAAIFGVYIFLVIRSLRVSLWFTALLILLLIPVAFLVRGYLSPVSFETERNIEGRLGIWIGSAYLIEDSPITGVGIGNFSTAIRQYPIYARYIPPAATPQIIEDYYLLTKADHAHNLYLHWVVEMGIPIGLIYSLLTFVVLYFAVKTALREDWKAAILCAVYVTMLVNGLFDMPLWASRPALLFWIVMGMVMGYAQQPHRE